MYFRFQSLENHLKSNANTKGLLHMYLRIIRLPVGIYGCEILDKHRKRVYCILCWKSTSFQYGSITWWLFMNQWELFVGVSSINSDFGHCGCTMHKKTVCTCYGQCSKIEQQTMIILCHNAVVFLPVLPQQDVSNQTFAILVITRIWRPTPMRLNWWQRDPTNESRK